MSEMRPGTIGWHDLTVDDAAGVRDFYKSVVGWTHEPVSMGDYDDYGMVAPGVEGAVAGVCHSRGVNTGMPAQWMMYIVVSDLEASLRSVRSGGGEVVGDVRSAGGGRFAVIRDPAGAVCGLYQSG